MYENWKSRVKKSIQSKPTFIIIEPDSSEISELQNVKGVIPEQSWFINGIYILIILNTINLILRTYPKYFSTLCDICDYLFTICFTIEVIILFIFKI